MKNLDGLTMYVSSTAANGVVDAATRLHFRQTGDRVMARYAGGNVVRGLLMGRCARDRLEFRYAQRERDGMIHGGRSTCELLEHEGRVRIVEHFEWSTRTGSGVNVFDEGFEALVVVGNAQAEMSHQFASPECGHPDESAGPAVRDPPPGDRDSKQFGSDRAPEMRTAFTPIETCERKSPALNPGGRDVDAKGRQ